jgi:probable dihydroxyacetone kinase regulator
MSESFRKLLATKPLNKISIREITDGCGLNRQTFYYHFQDIYALLEWMCQEEAETYIKKQKATTTGGGIAELLRYFKENEAVCASAINVFGDERFRSFVDTGIHDHIHFIVNEFSAGLQVPDKCKNFIAHFYALSFTAYLIEWIKGGLKPEPEELAYMLEVLLQDNLKNALERFSNLNP